MSKKKMDPIKKQLVRASSSEDQVLLDMRKNFAVGEIAIAYERAIAALTERLGKEDSVIARSILAMGMGRYLNSLAENMEHK